MANKARNTSGKFAPKSDTPRKIRSVNLTDEAWQWLASVAEQLGMSRNDYLEALAEGNIPFMEMVSLKTLPFMEMEQPECLPLMGTVQIEVDALREELTEVRSQLETERPDRKEVERELSELKQNSAPAATLSEEVTPDAATILSKLRAKRKKSKSDLADVEAILEILES